MNRLKQEKLSISIRIRTDCHRALSIKKVVTGKKLIEVISYELRFKTTSFLRWSYFGLRWISGVVEHYACLMDAFGDYCFNSRDILQKRFDNYGIKDIILDNK